MSAAHLSWKERASGHRVRGFTHSDDINEPFLHGRPLARLQGFVGELADGGGGAEGSWPCRRLRARTSQGQRTGLRGDREQDVHLGVSGCRKDGFTALGLEPAFRRPQESARLGSVVSCTGKGPWGQDSKAIQEKGLMGD